MPPTSTELVLAGAGGEPLPATLWQPAGRARATVIGLHGYGDFRLAFAEIGPWLAARGVALLAYDQRGFGEARGHGQWHDWRLLVADLRAVMSGLALEAEGPPFVLGESLGGGVALAAAAQRRGPHPAGLILAEPAVRKGARLRYVWDLVFGGLALVRPGLRRPLARGRHPLLTPAARQRLAEDPRIVRHIRADSYKSLLSLADAASAAARRVRVPTLLLYGRGDGIIPLRLLERAERDLAPVVTAIRYPQAPHLLLQAQGWEDVMGDVLAWLSGEPTPCPGGPGVLSRSGPLP